MSNNKDIVPQVITEFLEVAVHNIIHARKLYPDTIFIRIQKYGVVAYRSIHPQLNNYISDCMKCVYELIKKNKVSKFVIYFTKCHGIDKEQFIFDILSTQNLTETDPYFLQLETNLRIFLLRLNSRLDYLEPLSEDSLFSIQIQTTESAVVECMENPAFEKFPWITVNESKKDNTEIIPIQTIDSDYVKIQCYIQTKYRN